MMRVFACVAMLVVVPSAATAASITPVQKVLQMMADMKAKGLKEKDEETVAFTSAMTFCKDTMAAKEKAVSDAADEIEKLAADVERYDADAMVLGREIRKLDKAADKAKLKQQASHDKWVTTDEDYKELHAEYETNIADIEVGTAQLKAMMASESSASLIQQKAKEMRLPAKAKKVLLSFLETSSHTDLEASAPESGAFAGSSSPVIDLMNGLTEKMEEEKTKIEQEHVKNHGAFQMVQQTLFSQIDQHTTMRNMKAGTKKSKESSSAEAAAEKASTETSKASDEEFLEDLYSECATKSSEYEANQKVRAGEIVALNKAVEIMSGGGVTGKSEKHLPQLMQSAFVQLRSNASKKPSQRIAASFLEAQATRMHSKVLSALSVRVSADPFGKVKKMIQDMVYKLMEEANEEAEQKGFCDTELGTNKITRDHKTTAASELAASIDELQSQIEILGDQISSLSEQIAEIDASVATATALRADEKAKNTETIADALTASTAVKQALGVLQKYYDGLSLLQKKSALSVRSAAHSTSPTGVIGMLEVILSDFQRLESSTKASEETNQASYDKFMNDSSSDKAVKEQHIKNKSESRTEHDLNMKQAEKDLESTQKELAAAEAYYEKLKPSCVESGTSYEDRVARRKEEIESLKEALKILDENDIA